MCVDKISVPWYKEVMFLLELTIKMNKMNNRNKILNEFLTKFYEITSTVEANNYTLDEFYDNFSADDHKMLLKLIKNMKQEEKS